MHNKVIGNIGEMRIAADLMKRGFEVFTELGDNSRVDLIAIKKNHILKVQVKSYNASNGKVEVRTNKKGPGYMYTYEKDDVDLFAVYVPNYDIIFYLNWDDFTAKGGATIRVDVPKVKSKGIRMVNEFADLKWYGIKYDDKFYNGYMVQGSVGDNKSLHGLILEDECHWPFPTSSKAQNEIDKYDDKTKFSVVEIDPPEWSREFLTMRP